MKALGVVVKEKNQKIKPYLILEYIEGMSFDETVIKPPSLETSLDLLSQLKTAFSHLLLLGIVAKGYKSL